MSVLKYMYINLVLHSSCRTGKGGAAAIGTFQKRFPCNTLEYHRHSFMSANTLRIITKRSTLPKPVNNGWNG